MRTNPHKNVASSELWPHYSHQLPNYDFAHDDDDSSPQKHQSKIEHKPVQQQPVLRPGPRPRAPPLLSLNPVINRQLSPKNGNNTPTQHWYRPVHQQIPIRGKMVPVDTTLFRTQHGYLNSNQRSGKKHAATAKESVHRLDTRTSFR